MFFVSLVLSGFGRLARSPCRGWHRGHNGRVSHGIEVVKRLVSAECSHGTCLRCVAFITLLRTSIRSALRSSLDVEICFDERLRER